MCQFSEHHFWDFHFFYPFDFKSRRASAAVDTVSAAAAADGARSVTLVRKQNKVQELNQLSMVDDRELNDSNYILQQIKSTWLAFVEP